MSQWNNITSLIKLMLAGQVPEEIVPVLYGANLVVLTKKDEGIRPIAVGSVWRRMVSKLCCQAGCQVLSTKFQPKQLGFVSNEVVKQLYMQPYFS